jgi:hypothetical protein
MTATLTLGRIPTGGSGLYVLYIEEWSPQLVRWDGDEWLDASTHAAVHFSYIHGSFGPMPAEGSVREAWEVAGRPT